MPIPAISASVSVSAQAVRDVDIGVERGSVLDGSATPTARAASTQGATAAAEALGRVVPSASVPCPPVSM